MKPIKELWTPVLTNKGIFKDDYMVSNIGRVKQKRICKNGVVQYILVPIINSKRPMVKMFSNGKMYSKSIAKLVLSSFDYRQGCECANITYLDGDMKNCKLANLRYATDKTIFTIEDLKKKIRTKPHSSAKQKLRSNGYLKQKPASINSCMTCDIYPCKTGLEKLSTDFGAMGCRDYRPKPDES